MQKCKHRLRHWDRDGHRVRDGLRWEWGRGWGSRQGCPKLGSPSQLSTSTQLLQGPQNKFPWAKASSCPVRVCAISSGRRGVGSEAAAVAEVRAGSTAAS